MNIAALAIFSSLPHRQLRKDDPDDMAFEASSLPHRQLRNEETIKR